MNIEEYKSKNLDFETAKARVESDFVQFATTLFDALADAGHISGNTFHKAQRVAEVARRELERAWDGKK